MAVNRRIGKTTSIIFLATVTLFATVALWGCKKEKKQAAAPPPPTVTVEKVVLQTVPIHLKYVATTESIKTVDIRARVEGFLEERRFVEGDDVSKGDIVFVIEKAPYEAQLEMSLAQLAQDKAALSFASDQVKRYKPLAEQDFVTQESLDDYITKAREAAAMVKADLAQIKQNRLNLGYCTMYAPLDGRIGRTLVNVGNLVGAGDSTKLATIVQLDPMYVYFSPSEKDLRLIMKYRQEKDIPVDIILSDDTKHPHPGKVDFIDNTADPKANTINMRAVISNPEKTLLPGIYVQASLFLCDVPNTPLITEKAIAEDQTGMYVYVVGEDNKVEQRPVEVGFLYKHQKIIWKGLKAGERVITEGLQMIRPGMTVRIADAKQKNQGKAKASNDHATSKQPASKTKHVKSKTEAHSGTEKGSGKSSESGK
ncbi:MAG: efflux RND transporter periplasmic adaptor subunit [Deltaproteobacteria bacterium]|jgi:RND family efflux transporter MFP subunit|nr:efflux RND transporter periplasmic adaptor subunit [Deltaproteobacteria bacterium]